MRALFLIPGDGVSQLQALPAVASTARQLGFQIQVVCPAAVTGVWTLLKEVEKTIPFSFEQATLADWANLLGSVREPDFQACINLASGRQVDLMLSMSHIPTRVATAGFSATEKVSPPQDGWAAQALQAYLRPLGVDLDADAFRLSLPARDLEQAVTALPAGAGPLLLMAPCGAEGDWPADRWQALPDRIRRTVPSLRSSQVEPCGTASAAIRERAALVASSDVVLASDRITTELALLCGVAVVALGESPSELPRREGVHGLPGRPRPADLPPEDVLAALGLG
jgi:hypothetical protein